MMRISRWAAVILVVAMAGGGLWLSARRIMHRQLPPPPVAPEIQVRFEHLIVRGRATDDRRWEIEAESVELTRDQRWTRLNGLRRATLYAGDQPQLSARAKWARLESPSRNMELGGGVEVTSPSGLVMHTAGVHWQADEERLDSAGPVHIAIADTTVEAPRFSYLAQREQIVCAGGVRIKQGPNHLCGDKLTMDLAAETLEIAGNVGMRVQVAEGRELAAVQSPLGAMQGLLETLPKERP